jgi:hypothetical protein
MVQTRRAVSIERRGLRALACNSASSASFDSFSFDATVAAAPLISITSENEIKRAPADGG